MMLQFLIDFGDDCGHFTIGHACFIGIGQSISGLVSHQPYQGDQGQKADGIAQAEVFVCQSLLVGNKMIDALGFRQKIEEDDFLNFLLEEAVLPPEFFDMRLVYTIQNEGMDGNS